MKACDNVPKNVRSNIFDNCEDSSNYLIENNLISKIIACSNAKTYQKLTKDADYTDGFVYKWTYYWCISKSAVFDGCYLKTLKFEINWKF